MARQGAFEHVDAAMMVHPADADLISMDTIALQELHVQFHGKAAHAAAAPWDGRNALDAAVLGYMNIAALRQHIRPTERVHGVFTRGGDKANIVPAETSMEWIVRSTTIESLQPLKQRVLTSLECAATACACTVDHQWHGHTYADMVDNGPMVAAYVANAARLGRTVVDPAAVGRGVVGSTDMGNVSYLVPSIHPMIKVADDGIPIHTVDFAEWARSADGDKAVLDGAKVMAMTIVDLWTSPELRDATAAAFAERPTSVEVL
jgi:metal-dependent amidase/aminoacylase/carboxypeptidase family protein